MNLDSLMSFFPKRLPAQRPMTFSNAAPITHNIERADHFENKRTANSGSGNPSYETYTRKPDSMTDNG